MKRSRLIWLGAAAALLLATGGYFALAPRVPVTAPAGPAGSRADNAIPVVVASAAKAAVPITVRAVGNAEAYATVAIKSRVDGQLMDVHFADGQMVKKGDLLYTIDPRPFQTQLDQAIAVLARDRAQLENSRIDLARTEELHRKGYASQQQLDLARTTAAALGETIKTDEAAINGIRLQLDYTAIRAPFDGRAADTQVDAGNLVKANDVPLVVINETKPIYAAFSVPEQYAAEIRERMAKDPLEVDVSAPNVDRPAQKGVVTFINNAIDSATGTVLVKATLANADESLLPGQFITATLRLATIPDAVVVPSQAVQTGQQGQYVFVLTPEKTVEQRQVTVGEAAGADIVIRSGVSAGEQVVTDGQVRLYPGAHAKPAPDSLAARKDSNP